MPRSSRNKCSFKERTLVKTFSKPLLFLMVMFFFTSLIVVGRLFNLQVLASGKYKEIALDQYSFFRSLVAQRGEIYLSSLSKTDEYFPAAMNREYGELYAQPYFIEDPKKVMEALIVIFPELEERREELIARFSKKNDPYEPILHKISKEQIEKIQATEMKGLGIIPEVFRYYPENNMGSHILGFVNFDGNKQKGQYGIEGFFNAELAGKNGFIHSEQDALGSLISVADQEQQKPENGSKIYLTIDYSLQYYACTELNKAVIKHGAKGGSVIIVQPKTGKILSMCASPDFNPNEYQNVNDISVFNNPVIFDAYEPGSVIKPLTMAAALDKGAITPETTFEDKGFRKIDHYTIRNANDKKYGIKTMTEVLENSINTGAIFVAESIGHKVLFDYFEQFGLGKNTDIELIGENSGDISSLKKTSTIFLATASFGQGITVTPLQLIMAYAAVANDGRLMKPYLVEKIITPQGEEIKASPKELRQVISSRVATLLSGMLVSVLENGHTPRARVDGYYLAGKTGTAQVPEKDRAGYSDRTIHTFAGFGPVDNPEFAILIRIDEPKDVRFADSSAAPLFSQIARFMLNYLEIEPTKK